MSSWSLDRLTPEQLGFFRVPGPAVLSTSGGRTSALQLYLALAAFDWKLPADVHAVFCNTGREMPETLDFVQACSEKWNVKVRWLEYQPWTRETPHAERFREVSWQTASRDGSPFARMTEKERYLPNPHQRICTKHLKVLTIKHFMLAQGHEDWTEVVGYRADEPRRISKLNDPESLYSGRAVETPLARAGITKPDVLSFWSSQPFDLNLKHEWEGNCDLCFMKGQAKKKRIIRDNPGLVEWWIGREKALNNRFGAFSPTYSELKAQVETQPEFDFASACEVAPDDMGDCVCGDWS